MSRAQPPRASRSLEGVEQASLHMAQPPRASRSFEGVEQAILHIAIPPAVVELIAHRVAELIGDRVAPAGPEPWVGVDDVARHLGYGDEPERGRRRVWDLKARGLLACREDGRRLLFHLSDVDRYLGEAER